ncbi:MAG: hypothetical protein EBW88_03335, partial [Betaproteobacteria bacterium]|nr:hypothetical protein [Betaproteobacteria bacterium]
MRRLLRLLISMLGLLPIPGLAQVSDVGIRLRIEPEPSVALAKLPGKRPIFGWAESIEGSVDETLTLRGQAHLRQAGTALSASRIDYQHENEFLVAEGQVRMAKGGTIVQGPALRLKMDTQKGVMEDAAIAL